MDNLANQKVKNKKQVQICILSILLIIALLLAMGGTYAWFTNEDSKINTFQFGTLDTRLVEAGQGIKADATSFKYPEGNDTIYSYNQTIDMENVVQGESYDKIPRVVNNSSINAGVAVIPVVRVYNDPSDEPIAVFRLQNGNLVSLDENTPFTDEYPGVTIDITNGEQNNWKARTGLTDVLIYNKALVPNKQGDGKTPTPGSITEDNLMTEFSVGEAAELEVLAGLTFSVEFYLMGSQQEMYDGDPDDPTKFNPQSQTAKTNLEEWEKIIFAEKPEVKLNMESVDMGAIDSEIELKADGNAYSYTWKSDNTGVVEVTPVTSNTESKVRLKAIGNGVTNITVTATNGKKSVTATSKISVGSFTPSIENNRATIIEYNGAADTVDFPAYVNSGGSIYPVKEIGDGNDTMPGAQGITKLTLPEGLEKINAKVFSGCNGIEGSLKIPDSVKSIGDGAFGGCSGFTGNLTIPNNVESIGDYAFGGCRGFIDSLMIPNNVKSIGDGAFGSCSGFTGSLTISNNVERIGDGAFSGCNRFTGSLTIPDSVKSIGNEAFGDCSSFTGNLTIPDSVKSIGDYAFGGCTAISGGTHQDGGVIVPASVDTIGADAFGKLGGGGLGGQPPDWILHLPTWCETEPDAPYGFLGSNVVYDQ